MLSTQLNKFTVQNSTCLIYCHEYQFMVFKLKDRLRNGKDNGTWSAQDIKQRITS